MGFEEDVARYRQELRPRAEPEQAWSAPEWHAPLVEALTVNGLLKVGAYFWAGRKDAPRKRRGREIQTYTHAATGWVLKYSVEYRVGGYMTQGTFFVSEDSFFDEPTWIAGGRVTVPTNDAGWNSGKKVERVGIPKDGGFLVQKHQTDSRSNYLGLGAALIVALLRDGHGLHRRTNGDYSTF